MANSNRIMEKHTITYVPGEKLTGDGVFLYFELRNISDAILTEPLDNDIPIDSDLSKEQQDSSSTSGNVHSSLARDITSAPTLEDTIASTTKRVVNIDDGGDTEVDVKYEIAPSDKVSCENFSCNSLQVCQLNNDGTPTCICSPISKECAAAHDPVCGSDGITYSNECVMSGVACVHNAQVHVARKGRCDHSSANQNAFIMHAIYVAAIAIIVIIFAIIIFVICRKQRGGKAQTVYANPFYDQAKTNSNDKSFIQNGQGMTPGEAESARPLMPVPSSPPPPAASVVSQPTKASSSENGQRTPLLSPIDETGSSSPRYADDDDEDSIATRSERSSLLDRRDDRTKSLASIKGNFKTADSRNSDCSSLFERKDERSVSKMSLTPSEQLTQRPSESGDSNMDDGVDFPAPRKRTYSDTESEKSSY